MSFAGGRSLEGTLPGCAYPGPGRADSSELRSRGRQQGRIDAFAQRVVHCHVAAAVKCHGPDGVVVGCPARRVQFAGRRCLDSSQGAHPLSGGSVRAPMPAIWSDWRTPAEEEFVARSLGRARIEQLDIRDQVIGQVIGDRIGQDRQRGPDIGKIEIARKLARPGTPGQGRSNRPGWD